MKIRVTNARIENPDQNFIVFGYRDGVLFHDEGTLIFIEDEYPMSGGNSRGHIEPGGDCVIRAQVMI